jgi:hypothetical protein
LNIKKISKSTRSDVAGLVSIGTERQQRLAAVDEQAVSKHLDPATGDNAYEWACGLLDNA